MRSPSADDLRRAWESRYLATIASNPGSWFKAGFGRLGGGSIFRGTPVPCTILEPAQAKRRGAGVPCLIQRKPAEAARPRSCRNQTGCFGTSQNSVRRHGHPKPRNSSGCCEALTGPHLADGAKQGATGQGAPETITEAEAAPPCKKPVLSELNPSVRGAGSWECQKRAHLPL